MNIKFKVFGEHGFYTNVVLNPSDPCMSYGTYRRLIRENNGLIPLIYDPSCLCGLILIFLILPMYICLMIVLFRLLRYFDE